MDLLDLRIDFVVVHACGMKDSCQLYSLVREDISFNDATYFCDENRKAELNWPKRFNIIEGIAQGLLYLHEYSRMRVIHTLKSQ